MIKKLIDLAEVSRSLLTNFSFVASLLLRLYLVPVFWTAGMNKYMAFDDTVAWFGNSEWGLGLPFPMLNASLAIAAELGCSVLLALGLVTRLATIPLLFTMLVAALTVHLKNGWQVIHDPLSAFPVANISEVGLRLARVKEILKTHGDYDWLTEYGNLVFSNNGIEFIAAYVCMLLTLLVIGGGRYLSMDYWLWKLIIEKLKVRPPL